LQFHKEIVKHLLDHGAEISKKNHLKKKDNVLHSLIRHAANNPDKISNVVDMIHYLLAKEIKHPEKTTVVPVWRRENVDRLTPLKLATKKGVSRIVMNIMT